jgi:hypothetical protein
MARIAGIQIEKDIKGCPTYARFNLKKHPEALELLHKIGAIEEDEFEREWKRGLTIDEAKNEMHTRIKKWFNE